MRCFLLFITLTEVYLTKASFSVDLTASNSWFLVSDAVTLTCTLHNSTEQNIQIKWLTVDGLDNDHKLLSSFNLSDENSTIFDYDLNPSPGNSNATYLCEVNDVQSNELTIYFRDLAINQLPASKAVYKSQVVEVQILQFGDSSSLFCDKSESLVFISENESKLIFKAETSFDLKCTAKYSSDDYSMEKSIFIDVLEPDWNDWNGFSSCSIDTISTKCVRTRNRTCENINEFSTCVGDPEMTEECSPDDCDPVVSEWGEWGACEYDMNEQCQHSRIRSCNRALNSTRECQEELDEDGTCNKVSCDRWDNWSSWTRCHQKSVVNVTCVRERRRQCSLHGPTCVGENTRVAECDSSTCAPKFKSYGKMTVLRSYKQPFYITCNIERSMMFGYMGMTILWKRNNLLVANTAPVTTESMTYSDSGLTENERGLYACCVTNNFGMRCNDGWDVKLSDYGPVAVSSVEKITPLVIPSKSNYTLVCQFEGYKLHYEWYQGNPMGEGKIPGETTRWLEISGMSKSQRGHYSCCAYDLEKSNKSECSMGYSLTIPENTQRKYLIIIISVIVLLLLALILYITCAHTSKMNRFKRRLRSVFTGGHTKLYNGLDPFGTGQSIQRSHSYLKRLSRSHPLSKSELTTVVDKIANSVDANAECNDYELATEFDSVPNNSITVNKTPVGTESKNRYLNVLPNSHSRVLLPEIGKDPTSVYINANYIRGYKLIPKDYIATQGPMPSTAPDFWRMIWNEKCRIIVMTTGIVENNRMKCSLYWPASEDSGEVSNRFGTFNITQLEIYPSKFFTISFIRLQKIEEEEEGPGEEAESRIIYHIWYHSWPDFGVPEDTAPFLDFVEYVRAFKSSLGFAPVLVHCSAGIGRTGTFISVNLGIEQFQDTGKVDPLSYICQLRQDRGGMVQTLDQYSFVYRALLAYQVRLAERGSKESRNTAPCGSKESRYTVACGPPTLLHDNELLPTGIDLPELVDPDGSRVNVGFISNLTQTLPCVSRYSDSVTSVNNISGDDSNDSTELGNGTPNHGAHRPLISESSVGKQKRKSKVKSLFFSPSSPRTRVHRASERSIEHEMVNLETGRRSLSLNNMDDSRLVDGNLDDSRLVDGNLDDSCRVDGNLDDSCRVDGNFSPRVSITSSSKCVSSADNSAAVVSEPAAENLGSNPEDDVTDVVEDIVPVNSVELMADETRVGNSSEEVEI